MYLPKHPSKTLLPELMRTGYNSTRPEFFLQPSSPLRIRVPLRHLRLLVFITRLMPWMLRGLSRCSSWRPNRSCLVCLYPRFLWVIDVGNESRSLHPVGSSPAHLRGRTHSFVVEPVDAVAFPRRSIRSQVHTCFPSHEFVGLQFIVRTFDRSVPSV